jgi:thymidylate synthase ThyX
MSLRVSYQHETASEGSGAPFVSALPAVRLLTDESSAHPFATTIAAAWSCYGEKPARVENVLKLVHGPAPADLSTEAAADREDRRERALRLYSDLFAGGHHTTFQHANFTFVLDNVSRLAIWSFFHSHPHYNSEQVSQRYREVSGNVMTTPDLPGPQLDLYRAAIEQSLEAYRSLTNILSVDALVGYGQVFPSRVKAEGEEAQAKVAAAVQKKAQEVARYVLPLATPAHLYHTVNGLTLLRYYVLAGQPDVPAEVRYIVQRMIDEVLVVDPYFLGSPEYPLNLRPLQAEETLESQMFARWHETVEQRADDAERFCADFDAQLSPWRNSRLTSFNPRGEAALADAVRTVLGSSDMPDDEALAVVLSGADNPYLGHALYLGMNSKLMQTLNHVPFTFQKRISGAEDAQNQRHRGTLASRPILQAHLRREPDVITPWAIARNPEALAVYQQTVQALWDAKNALIDGGAPVETALYLLPNSHRIRFYESGTLMNYYWKWIKRLCYDAQREIFETAVEEVAQVREVHPVIGHYVDGPPCVMRSRTQTRPFCPEGERYCGIPVWRNHQFETLEGRRIL